MSKQSESNICIGQKEADYLRLEPLRNVVSGWRAGNIAVRCGAWAGHFAAQFLLGELGKFGKEIEYLCEGLKPKVEFKSAEHYLDMSLARDSRGRIHVEGQARERPGSKTALGFEFDVDTPRCCQKWPEH
jgi:hypothetical protein